MIADPRWQLREPVELGALQLLLDESPRGGRGRGERAGVAAVRPLRAATERFDRYTAAIKRLDPPSLFESRPSYRLLGADLSERRLESKTLPNSAQLEQWIECLCW